MILAIHGLTPPLYIKILSIVSIIVMAVGVYYVIDKIYISARKRVKEAYLKSGDKEGKKYLLFSSTIRILISVFLLYCLFSFSLQIARWVLF